MNRDELKHKELEYIIEVIENELDECEIEELIHKEDLREEIYTLYPEEIAELLVQILEEYEPKKYEVLKIILDIICEDKEYIQKNMKSFNYIFNYKSFPNAKVKKLVDDFKNKTTNSSDRKKISKISSTKKYA